MSIREGCVVRREGSGERGGQLACLEGLTSCCLAQLLLLLGHPHPPCARIRRPRPEPHDEARRSHPANRAAPLLASPPPTSRKRGRGSAVPCQRQTQRTATSSRSAAPLRLHHPVLPPAPHSPPLASHRGPCPIPSLPKAATAQPSYEESWQEARTQEGDGFSRGVAGEVRRVGGS